MNAGAEQDRSSGPIATAALRVIASRWLPVALLAVSVAAHVVFSLVGADPFKLIDLRVYVDGAEHLGGDTLYTFTSGIEELPFTYPPFAAMVFWPLSLLPWVAVAVLWEIGCVTALAAIVYLTVRLLGRAGPGAAAPLPHLPGVVLTATAIGMWAEPVRSTFNYGQINLFLAVLVLAGAVSVRQWWAGASVGLAAGIKLTPAITGLYYLLARRYAAVGASVLTFAVTVAAAAVVGGGQLWRYFTELIFDPARTGAVWVVRNQGWRGALYRLLGEDSTAAWAGAVVVCLAVGIGACVLALRAGDRCAALLAVQLIGVLVSPISWSHHWVLAVPLVLWCAVGPLRRRRGVQVLGWAWAAVCLLMVVPILIAVEGLHLSDEAVRPLWESTADAVYPVLGTVTLVVLVLLFRQRPAHRDRRAAAAAMDVDADGSASGRAA